MNFFWLRVPGIPRSATIATTPGMRHANLKKSFKLALKPLLTACSKENVDKAMPTFSVVEREAFHRFLVKVMGKLHESIENEFEAICQETQVGTILDTVEQLVEEQSVDILREHKPNIEEVMERSIRVKTDEVRLLMDAIEKVEEQKKLLKARIASINENQNIRAGDAVGKLSSWNAELLDIP